MRSFFILFSLLFFITSCAQKPEEQVREAIDVALSHLSKEECDKALKVLLKAGVQNNNAIYLQVLASAYACKAGYDEISFIANDLENLDASDPNVIFQSIAALDIASESSADSSNYVSIRTGLRYLLNSTTAVGHVAREEKFGKRKAGDMATQILLLSIVNFGKFIHYYGNVDSSGEKGAGTGSNNCFINYTDSRAQLIVTALPVANSCRGNFSSGHPELSFAAPDLERTKRRLCEGLMTITNVINVLENLDFSASDELSKLEDVATQVSTYKTAAEAAGLGTLINTYSQSACETLLNTPANLNDMQLLMALLFETGLE